jgi:two-component system, NarL family, sensor histidine kinase UhpB
MPNPPSQQEPGRPPAPGWIESILRVSLFTKIVLANAVLVGLLGALALILAPALQDAGQQGWLLAGWMAGLVAVISVNGLLVHLALRPIRNVEEAARRVEAGDTGARVPHSPLADREFQRVTEVVNRMLDSLEAARVRQMELSARILDAEEGERKRIAEELFGDTAQLLSATLLQVKLADRSLEGLSVEDDRVERAHRALDAARDELLGALRGLQRIARGLRPPELDELGPTAALEMQARHLVEAGRARIDFSGEPVDRWLEPRSAVALYRILQEGLSNAITHGEAHRIQVSTGMENGRVRAELVDDGRGFDTGSIVERPERHVGVLRMKERARHAGGTLQVDSRPGEGTRLTLILPAQPPRASRVAK